MAFVAGAALACVDCSIGGAEHTAVAVTIDNFMFESGALTVKAGTTVTWTNRDDIPHTVASKDRAVQVEGDGHRRDVFVHIHDTGRVQLFLLLASAHDGNHRGRGDGGERRFAMMLAGRRRSDSAERAVRTMAGDVHDPERARRFRDAALPHLDEVYTLARYLLRNAADADDAVQECYLRALKHFDTFRGGADPAVAVRHPAQRLQRRPTRSAASPARTRRRRRAAAVERAAGDAGDAMCCASATTQSIRGMVERAAGCVPRGDRAARDQRSVLSRDRRDRRRAGRHGDVAAGARPLDAARGLAGGRGEGSHDDVRRSQGAAARADRRRARCRPRARGRGACRRLPALRRGASRSFARCARRWPARTCASPRRRRCARGSRRRCRLRVARAPRRRGARCCKGFAFGTALSAAAAAGVVFVVTRSDEDERMLGDVVSAHLRSLQADASDRCAVDRPATVKPGSTAGRRAPPVIDLTAQGFTWSAGGSTIIDGKPVAAIVYRRGATSSICSSRGRERRPRRRAAARRVQGFNMRRWSDQGMRFIAISDIGADELRDFHVQVRGGVARGRVSYRPACVNRVVPSRSMRGSRSTSQDRYSFMASVVLPARS